MFILAILLCLAALFVGWSLGPLGLKIAQKVKKSADDSQAEAKKGNDFLLPYIAEAIIPAEHYDDHHQAKFLREPFLIFIPLILALIFQKAIFWVIVLLVFFSIFWREVLSEIWHFIVGGEGH